MIKKQRSVSATTQYVRNAVKLERDSNGASHTVINQFRYVLINDVETTTDFSQKLRLSGYMLYDLVDQAIVETGLTTGLLSDQEQAMILDYARSRNLSVWSHQEFIKERLYPLLEAGTALINHNIVFDLGAMATSWLAVGHMFYLKLCDCKPDSDNSFVCSKHPCIAVHSLTFPKALIYVASDKPYGAILDTMTLGKALLGPGELSLKGLGTRFKCATVKLISDEHGTELSSAYLDYTLRDVQATLELFLAELAEYRRHGLQAPITTIMSEASIGKAYVHQLGIPAFKQQHSYLPEWVYAIGMIAYYGARSEVKIRLAPTEIRYCDFKSQYPTVNALMHLQELLLAEHIDYRDVTQHTQKLLSAITLSHLQKPDVWKKLRVIVKLAPDGDIVPNKFETVTDDGDKETGYAVCTTYAPGSWYTLADVIASKLLTNKTPIIEKAIELLPHGRIATNKLHIYGDTRFHINLATDDFFTKVIDLRTSVKQELKAAKKAGDNDQVAYLDSLQLALKLIANSTSYGVLVETRYEKGIETAGKYFASPIATHITGAARLLLAIAEKLGTDRGLTYAMCDTDSMAFARPDGMTRDTFYSLVDEIVAWFNPLSPYADKAALFELEDVNFNDGKDTPLYFLGVSCKRYVLYNKVADGSYQIRKLSAHATGRYQFDKNLPMPDGIPVSDGHYKTWQYLLWYRAIEQAEKGITEIVIPNETWSNNIARYQESVSTPYKAKLYRYLPGLRPYQFFTAFTVSSSTGKRYIMPYAPTHDAIERSTAFIAGSMEIVATPGYDTLRDRFRDFFSHQEIKAANGNDVGLLERRVIRVDSLAKRTRTGKKIAPTETTTVDASQATLWSNTEIA